MAAEVDSLRHQIHNNDQNTLPIEPAMDETEPDTPDQKNADPVYVIERGNLSSCEKRTAPESEARKNSDKNIDDEQKRINQDQTIDATGRCDDESGEPVLENASLTEYEEEESTLIFQADESTLVLENDPKTLEIEPESGEDKTLEWAPDGAALGGAMHVEELAGDQEDGQTLAYTELDDSPSPITAGPSLGMGGTMTSCKQAEVISSSVLIR